jgi:hypothetical protein
VLKKSIGDSGMKLAFWVFIVSALAVTVSVVFFLFNIFSTGLVDFTIEQFKSYGFALGISFIVAFISFWGLVLTVPPEINRGKENEINKLDNKLNSFIPNIDLIENSIKINDVGML